MGEEKVEELNLLRKMSREFALKELREGREERDRYPFVPLDQGLLRKVEEVGFLSLLQGEAVEMREGLRGLCLVLEGLAMEDASLAGVIFAHSLSRLLLSLAGGADVVGRLESGGSVGGEGDGERSLIAFPCFDFPRETAGRLRAERAEDGYRLTGRAEFVILGNLAALALLPAGTEGAEGFSLFACPLREGGVQVGPAALSLGLRCCPASDLVLEGARSLLVGEEGRGEEYWSQASDLMALAAASMSLGVMKGSFREALEYARMRVQGGREIVGWSEVRMILSRMALQCRSGEMLLDAALREAEEGAPGWRASARAAALKVQEDACHVASDGVQLLGGNGYMRDYGQEKRFRDAHQLKVLLGHHPLRQLEFLALTEEA